jgi:Rieske Fe-S protein
MQQTDHPERRPHLPGTSRRSLLAAAGAVGAAGIVAACGGGSETADPADTSTSAASPTESAAGSSPPAAGGGEALAKTSDVPVGGALFLEGPNVVLTQPATGDFKAFSSICTHQSCPINRVAESTLICQCHFSAFKITDGSPTTNPENGRRGPAPSPLKEIRITVEGDSVIRS